MDAPPNADVLKVDGMLPPICNWNEKVWRPALTVRACRLSPSKNDHSWLQIPYVTEDELAPSSLSELVSNGTNQWTKRLPTTLMQGQVSVLYLEIGALSLWEKYPQPNGAWHVQKALLAQRRLRCPWASDAVRRGRFPSETVLWSGSSHDQSDVGLSGHEREVEASQDPEGREKSNPVRLRTTTLLKGSFLKDYGVLVEYVFVPNARSTSEREICTSRRRKPKYKVKEVADIGNKFGGHWLKSDPICHSDCFSPFPSPWLSQSLALQARPLVYFQM